MRKQYNMLLSNGHGGGMTSSLITIAAIHVKRGDTVLICSRDFESNYFQEQITSHLFGRWDSREKIEALSENMGTIVVLPNPDNLLSAVMHFVNSENPKPLHLCIDCPEEINPDVFTALRRNAGGLHRNSPYASMFRRRLLNDAASHELVHSVTAVARVS